MTVSIEIYRSVLLTELRDLERLGRFRNPYGNEVKYFALARKGAARYAILAAAMFGEGPFWLVSATFPSRFVGWRLQAIVDQGIATLVVSTNLLVELRTLKFLGPI